MNLVEQIQKDLVRSMKEKDTLRTSTLRMIKAAVKNREIDKKNELSEAETLQVLATMVKQRKEAVEQFAAGGRTDLVEKERREITIIESYLPEPLSAEELDRVVSSVVRDVDASSLKDMGRVMKEAMVRLQASGKTVDGKAVNALVRSRLQELGQPKPD
jgi:uncharacterized protein YqeY